jgi:hypothetical protein
VVAEKQGEIFVRNPSLDHLHQHVFLLPKQNKMSIKQQNLFDLVTPPKILGSAYACDCSSSQKF